jgi:murein DD-endopeptidase MepM/ murein hydrolase activator NlpD
MTEKNRRLSKIAGIILFLLIAVSTGFFWWEKRPAFEPATPSALSSPRPPEKILTGKIEKGQTLSTALRPFGLSQDLSASICRELQSVVNLNRVKPGDSFEIRLAPTGELKRFSFRTGPLGLYHLSPAPEAGWRAWKEDIQVDRYWARIEGEITSSLFEAVAAQGEQDKLILDFADIFAWEIDFYMDPRAGDRFRIVVEKDYVAGTFVRYGRILYAEYQGAGKRLEAFYYQDALSRGDYFTPEGQSLRKALLRSPLKFTYISSGFSRARKHPILGGLRPHLGIDYAARAGTPVWAIGDGIVIFCGWNGGYGKQVIIRHRNGYESMYGHLSRFGPGIRKGKQVQQKQVIGYVGSTGLSTGPHLDFRLKQKLVFLNPLKQVSPRAAPLQGLQMRPFQESMRPLLHFLDDSKSPSSLKVATRSSQDL